MLQHKTLPGNEMADIIYEVASPRGPLFRIGFKRMNLLAATVYITFWLHLRPTLAELREARRLFASLRGYLFYAQVNPGETLEPRFLEFFGFKSSGQFLDRITYFKETR